MAQLGSHAGTNRNVEGESAVQHSWIAAGGILGAVAASSCCIRRRYPWCGCCLFMLHPAACHVQPGDQRSLDRQSDGSVALSADLCGRNPWISGLWLLAGLLEAESCLCGWHFVCPAASKSYSQNFLVDCNLAGRSGDRFSVYRPGSAWRLKMETD